MKMIRQLAAVGTTLALLLTPQAISAQQCCPPPDPCMDWCNFCGDWEFGAHALVFNPTVCEFDFATTQNANNRDAVSTVKCQLDWGFRVFGAYLSRCSFIGVSYQWYESKVADSLTGTQLVSRQNDTVNRVKANLRLEYQNVDVRWGKFLHRTCGCAFYLYGNARWVDLKYRRTVQGATTAGFVRTFTQRSKLQGGAVGVGAGADFDLWCDIGIFGDLNLLGVIAERSTRDTQTLIASAGATPATVQFRYGSDTCINPELDFRLGLNYTYTCGCWTFVGEVGYELDYFWEAFAFSNFNAQTGPFSTFRTCEDVGFSGLFFGGRVLF